MLTLTIKKKWFDMILSGEKKEEDREIKPYWTKRLAKGFGYLNCATFVADVEKFENDLKDGKDIGSTLADFRNGYGKCVPSFVAYFSLSIGTGKEDWGAEAGKEYYVLKIHEITERKNY